MLITSIKRHYFKQRYKSYFIKYVEDTFQDKDDTKLFKLTVTVRGKLQLIYFACMDKLQFSIV